MNINTLTIKAQEALQRAVSLARERGQQAVGPIHLLRVLTREEDSLSSFLLGRVGVQTAQLAREVERELSAQPRVEGGDPYLSPELSRVIQRGVDFTKTFGDKYESMVNFCYGQINRPDWRLCQWASRISLFLVRM